MRTPGSETLDKTIHGVAVSQNTFKRAIAEALQEMPDGGGALDVLHAVGPEWDTPEGRKVLSQTVINMWKAGVLKRVEGQRGTYTVAGGFHRKGLGASDQIERSVVDSIRKRGGFARFSEIMDDHGLRAHGDELKEARARLTRKQFGQDTPEDHGLTTAYDVRNTTGYHQIMTVLERSDLIRQDLLMRGWYNLGQDELNKMTLRGLYGGYMVMTTVRELGGNEKQQFAARDAFFAQVGSVYNEARNALKSSGRPGFSRKEFIRRPKVAAALYSLMQEKDVARELNDWYAGETTAKIDEMKAAGATPQQIADFREDRRNSREGNQVLFDLLERFEEAEPGYGVNIHCCAPVSFYEVLAAEMGIDPVMASRGVLILDLRGEKMRPRVAQADAERLGQLDAFRERMAERQ